MRILLILILLSPFHSLSSQLDSTSIDEFNRLIGYVFLKNDTISEVIHCCESNDSSELLVYGDNLKGVIQICRFEGSHIDTIFYYDGQFQKRKDYINCGFPSSFSFYLEKETTQLNDSSLSVVEYYDNNQVFYTGNLIHGKKHGIWKYYFYNGQLNAIGEYDSKVQWENVFTTWTKPDYCHGDISSTDLYGQESSKIGKWKFYYKSKVIREIEGKDLKGHFEFGG